MGRRTRAALALPAAALALGACDLGEDPVVYDTPRFNDIAVADLDGDGDLDATTAAWAPTDAVPGYVGEQLVLRNDGTGVFTTEVQDIADAGSRHVALGDLDGDGDLDRVDRVRWPFDPALLVQLNDGDGGFTRGASVPTAADVLDESGLALADLDGDGALDAVRSSGPVTVHPGLGDGTFGAARTLGTAGMGAGEVATADVDGDGDTDVVALTRGRWQGAYNVNGASVLLNDGSGTFAAPVFVPSGATLRPLAGLAVGDLDGDGDADIVQLVSGAVVVALGDGAGAFTAVPPIPTLLTPYTVDLAGDIDEDGRTDLAVSGMNGARNVETFVLFGDGAGGAEDPLALAPVGTIRPEVADLDGDGVPDLLVSRRAEEWSTTPFDGVSTYRNRLDGERPGTD